MKLLPILLSAIVLASSTRGAFFTNSPDADTFVRSNAPTLNYGTAGALSVSGIYATNATGVTNGAFDSFIRFNATAMVTNFNGMFGTNNWAVTSAKIVVTESGAPTQAVFNRGKGAFEIRWIASDNWVEGTGTPSAPTTDGLTYNNEPALLNSSTDASLGVFTNAGANVTLSFPLGLPPAFTGDLLAGGEVDLFLTAKDPKTGFTFNSQNFATVSARPFLIISALPRPVITSISLNTTNLTLTVTNGAAGGTYVVLASTNLVLPPLQWIPVATNVLGASGDFTINVTNEVYGSGLAQAFFRLQAQ
ncbi:MAG: hypothetical protein WCH99_02180 [Verrucomicrobiota bacterium]